MESRDREQVRIDRLSDDQRGLLQVYLEGASIPFELTSSTVTVDARHVDDLYSALTIVGDAEPLDGAALDDTDAESSPTARPPVVAARPLVVHGQAVASPTRRFVGALIDWVIITAYTILADRAGMPNWVIVAAFGVYVVLATAVFGRTIGKFLVGIKVIGSASGDVPGMVRSIVRWFTVSWGALIELFFGTWPIGIATTIFAILVVTYAPILWDPHCKGWHDRAADTVVVRLN